MYDFDACMIRANVYGTYEADIRTYNVYVYMHSINVDAFQVCFGVCMHAGVSSVCKCICMDAH